MALWSQESWSCWPRDWKSWGSDLMTMYMPEHKQWKCWLLVQMAWTRSKLQTLPWAQKQVMSCWGNVLTQEEVADAFPPVICKGGMSSYITHRIWVQSRKNDVQAIKNVPARGAGVTTAHPKGVWEWNIPCPYSISVRVAWSWWQSLILKGNIIKALRKCCVSKVQQSKGLCVKYRRARMYYKGLPACLGTHNRVFLCQIIARLGMTEMLSRDRQQSNPNVIL